MKKELLRICAAMLVAGLPVLLNSCNKDEEVPKTGIAFATDVTTVKESDGTAKSFHPILWRNFANQTGATGRAITIDLTLDKPAAENVVVEYKLSGTAVKNSSTTLGDYELDGNYFVIQKGSSSAKITVTLFEDFAFEVGNDLTDEGIPYETIVLELTSVVAGPGELGTQKTHTVQILEDDGIVYLDWDAGSGTRGDVDMDAFLWMGDEIINASDNIGNSAEIFSIPAGMPNGNYGLSYTYYSGTAKSVKYDAEITNFGGTITYKGTSSVVLTLSTTLTDANINRYTADLETEEGHEFYKGQPVVVQTITKNGFNYTNVTDLVVPTAEQGSRMDTGFSLEKGSIMWPKTTRMTFRPQLKNK